MHPPPAGWPRISTAIVYRDARAAIDWLCGAFGFELRLLVEDEKGGVRHSELTYGGGLLMVAQEDVVAAPRFGVPQRSPLTLAGINTQNLMLYVDDVEAHCARARAAGARIIAEIETHDYGDEYWADRSYGAVDPEGHMWWISQRIRGA